MKRKDMRTDGTLYAIVRNHMARPGYVFDTGTPGHGGKDVRVRTFWRWPDCDQDWMNPEPNLIDPTCKFDDGYVGTADVQGLWADYCATVKAERAQALQARLDAEAAHEAAKQAELARLEAVAYLVPTDESRAYLDISDLRYLIEADRGSDTRYSARHVLALLEYIADRTDLRQPPAVTPEAKLSRLAERLGARS